MTWAATARYQLAVVPGELGLVQDFLNTIEEGSVPPPDLLANLESAQRWAEAAAAEWESVSGDSGLHDLLPLTESDLVGLRQMRDRLFDALFGEDSAPDAHPVFASSATPALGVTPDGVELRPTGSGLAYFESVLLIACLRGELDQRFRRMKTCRSHECNIVFYDRSPNNSAVWHDVKLCGNRANVRAHRARMTAKA